MRASSVRQIIDRIQLFRGQRITGLILYDDRLGMTLYDDFAMKRVLLFGICPESVSISHLIRGHRVIVRQLYIIGKSCDVFSLVYCAPYIGDAADSFAFFEASHDL